MQVTKSAKPVSASPTRPKRVPSPSPTPADVKAVREALGLTQTEAGEILHASWRTWQDWEAGKRKMHAAFWELLCLKTGWEVKPKRSKKAG